MSAPETTLEALVAARELIARPGGWTQGVYARDAAGAQVSATSDEACRFCTAGALRRVRQGLDYFLPLTRVMDALGPGACGVGYWNDAPERTQAEVIAVFDKAIEAERGAMDFNEAIEARRIGAKS